MNCRAKKYKTSLLCVSGGGVNSSVSAHWANSSIPPGFIPEAVSTYTLSSVKHKFLLLLLPDLVPGGGEYVVLMDRHCGYGLKERQNKRVYEQTTANMGEAMEQDGRLRKRLAIRTVKR